MVCYRYGLTHSGRVTHICVGNLIIIGSDNGLSPVRRQAIIRTNAEILLIGHLGTNFSEILIGIQIFSFNKTYLKLSSAKGRPFWLNVLNLGTNFREILIGIQTFSFNKIYLKLSSAKGRPVWLNVLKSSRCRLQAAFRQARPNLLRR